ncbi:hypothetical protein AKJ09_08231 [Labilithrix luteola]|uniref:Uncharacterized protein n=1 Tax=Labilithrix luteola TaxID=1391654 RepID=A0A0K1Q753_9BACT|nr:hypothetical protein AKJ09_08231 [Labilithrix luteola]
MAGFEAISRSKVTFYANSAMTTSFSPPDIRTAWRQPVRRRV